MHGLLGLSSGSIKLPSFLNKNKIVASNGDATISSKLLMVLYFTIYFLFKTSRHTSSSFL